MARGRNQSGGGGRRGNGGRSGRGRGGNHGGLNRTLVVLDGADHNVPFSRNDDGTYFLRYEVRSMDGSVGILRVTAPTETILRNYHKHSDRVRHFNDVIQGDVMDHFDRFENEVAGLVLRWGGAAVRDDIRFALADFQREGRHLTENQMTRFDDSVRGGLLQVTREERNDQYDAVVFLGGDYAGIDQNDFQDMFGGGGDDNHPGAGNAGGAAAI